MKQRVLSLGLKGAVDAFESIKWKFYSVEDDKVVVEVPRGLEESFIVELPFSNAEQKTGIVNGLTANNFLEQKVRIVTDW